MRRPSGLDPRVDIGTAPVIRRNRVGPVSEVPIELPEIQPADPAVFREIKPVATADVGRRRLANLHRSLGSGWVEPPHRSIPPVARFCPVYRKGDVVEHRPRCRPFSVVPLRVRSDRFGTDRIRLARWYAFAIGCGAREDVGYEEGNNSTSRP